MTWCAVAGIVTGRVDQSLSQAPRMKIAEQDAGRIQAMLPRTIWRWKALPIVKLPSLTECMIEMLDIPVIIPP